MFLKCKLDVSLQIRFLEEYKKGYSQSCTCIYDSADRKNIHCLINTMTSYFSDVIDEQILYIEHKYNNKFNFLVN